MSKAAGVGYLEEVPVGTFVRVGDLPGSRAAARQCLAREARDPHGLVARVAHGLYWRARLYEQPFTTRAGETVTKSAPDLMKLARYLAGPGCGETSYGALRRFGLTLQITPRVWLAVVGRSPRSPNPDMIRFFGRSNRARRELTFHEVTLLEAAGCYGSSYQLEPWGAAMIDFSHRSIAHYETLLRRNGPRTPPPLPVERHDLIKEVAGKDDRRLGHVYLNRVEQMLDIAAGAYDFAQLNALHTS